MPVLNFYGQFDHLVPPEACNKLPQAVGSKDVEDICLETGHIGNLRQLQSSKTICS